jgi:imidazolonepropionase-like amidohydrolase
LVPTRPEGDRGSIAEGKRTDLVLAEGNPAEKIGDVFRVKHVWRDGVEQDLATTL